MPEETCSGCPRSTRDWTLSGFLASIDLPSHMHEVRLGSHQAWKLICLALDPNHTADASTIALAQWAEKHGGARRMIRLRHCWHWMMRDMCPLSGCLKQEEQALPIWTQYIHSISILVTSGHETHAGSINSHGKRLTKPYTIRSWALTRPVDLPTLLVAMAKIY
jgi:hypothetical protein